MIRQGNRLSEWGRGLDPSCWIYSHDQDSLSVAWALRWQPNGMRHSWVWHTILQQQGGTLCSRCTSSET